MAINLKRRPFVAESITQVIQEEPIPKKFKYLLKASGSSSSGSAFIGILESRTTSNEVLQLLLRMSETLNFKVEEVPLAIEKLSQRFKIENESVVRSVILSIFADIGGLSEIKTEVVKDIVDETIKLLLIEKSHRVKSQGLSTLLRLGKKFQDDSRMNYKLVNEAKKFLSDTSPLVKCKCFDIIGSYLSIEPSAIDSVMTSSSLLKLVSSYIVSDDARLRTTAFETMDILHNRGLKLDPDIYSNVWAGVIDDHACVRIAALKVVWLLGTTYRDNMISTEENKEGLRFVDDAFNRICNGAFDSVPQVRVKSIKLLGSMKDVSFNFLEQTLEKKLMSNMKKKQSAHERSKMSMAKGTWLPKKGWTQDKPGDLIDGDCITLINQGACGAFAYGLEDEFLEVRSATIDALCELSASHPGFSLQSQDFLVDMFNDDIEEVRLNAIHSLSKISKELILREDQLDTILSVLEDSSMDVREGVHRILTSCQLSTKDCLQMAVNDLIDSLKKFPQDRKSVWNCFHKMGSLHASLTLPLVPELLSIHPFFDTPEQNVDDPAYIGVLVLVFNAAQHCCTMLQLFEEKTIKHYSYLRDTIPHLVPPLPIIGSLQCSELKPVKTNTLEFLENMLRNIELSSRASIRINLLEIAEKDLSSLSQIDRDVAGAAQFLSLYISSQLKLTNVLKNKLWYSNGTLEHETSVVKSTIEQLIQSVIKMRYMFVGLNNGDLAAIKQLRLKILSLILVFIIRATNQSARALCHYFLSQVDEINRYLTENNLNADAFTSQVLKQLSALEETKPGTVARVLLPVLQQSAPIPSPKPNANIRMCHAIINSPCGGPDVTYKFTAGMVMGIPLDADLYHLHNTKALRIQIKYPDQQTHLIMPRINHLRPILFESDKSNTHRLVTTALISHQVWSDSCFVDLNLALDLTDVESVLSNCLRLTNQPCVIQLCKPTKLLVLPKPVKRGI